MSQQTHLSKHSQSINYRHSYMEAAYLFVQVTIQLKIQIFAAYAVENIHNLSMKLNFIERLLNIQ